MTDEPTMDDFLRETGVDTQEGREIDPNLVFYGITPWVPAKDVTYTYQYESGAWAEPRPGHRKPRCGHCLGSPGAAGMALCPGCHRHADPRFAERLAALRRRAAIFAGNGVPLIPSDPPDPTPPSVLDAKWDDVTESKSHPTAKQAKQAKAQANAQHCAAKKRRARVSGARS